MRAYARIKFDHPVTEQHYISLGGYEVIAGGKNYQFDFTSSERCIDSEHPEIVEFYLRDEDNNAFPEVAELKNHLSEISKIEDFYVYTGEENDLEINCVEIQDFVIEVAGYGNMPPHNDTEYIYHKVYETCDDWTIQYHFTNALLKQINTLWKPEESNVQKTTTYRVCVTKYGYADIDATNNDDALKAAEKLPDSAFDWGEAGDAVVVETFCNGNPE